MKFLAFDTPSQAPYRGRHVVVQGAVQGCRNALFVGQELVTSNMWLLCKFEAVKCVGGEGLMVRDPSAPYVHGRTNKVLKVKVAESSEGVVLDHLPGKGKHEGGSAR